MNHQDSMPLSAVQIQDRAAKFVSDVYLRMMLAIAAASLVGFLSIDSGLLHLGLRSLGRTFSLAIWGSQLLTVIAFHSAVFKLKATMTQLLFAIYTMLTGLTLGLVGLIYKLDSITTIGLSAALGFAALAFYGKLTKRDLSALGSFCLMGLTMLLVYSIGIWLGSYFMDSSSPFLDMAGKIQGFVGVLLFAGITTYEAQKLQQIARTLAKEMPSDEALESYVNAGALNMFMNFIGLFLSLLRLFGSRR